MIRAKRIYETAKKEDGYRILVDRLWPRGISKEKADIDLWLNDIAPSSELRKWFNHDQKKWQVFIQKYSAELNKNTAAVNKLIELEKSKGVVTIVYAAKEVRFNNAVAIIEFLNHHFNKLQP